LKIAFYFTSEISPDRGGTERVTHAISNQLKKFGVDSIYIAFKRHSNNLINPQQYYLPNSNTLICSENIRFVDGLLKERQINVLINQDSFDIGSAFCTKKHFPDVACLTVIHYNLFGSSTYVGDSIRELYLLGKTSKLKYAVQRLVLPYYKYKAKKQRIDLLRRIYDTADHIILLSEADKNGFPTEDKSRLHVITNPLTLSPVFQKQLKKKKVLFVGRMVFSQKRVDLLLKAWKIVENRHPDWDLDLLGDGSCLDYYKFLSQKMGLRHVNFHGNRPPEDYYKQSSILCMTSTYEGFGLVLTEAMQAGTVPIAFNSFEAINEIIEDGVDGLLVKPFNVKAYAGTIIKLIEDDELRNKMSPMAMAKVKKFSIEKIGSEWLAMLNEIC